MLKWNILFQLCKVSHIICYVVYGYLACSFIRNIIVIETAYNYNNRWNGLRKFGCESVSDEWDSPKAKEGCMGRKSDGARERDRNRWRVGKRWEYLGHKKRLPNAWSNQLMLNVKLCPSLGSTDDLDCSHALKRRNFSASITTHQKYLFI